MLKVIAKQNLPILAIVTLPVTAQAQLSLEQLTLTAERVCKDAPLESRGSKTELSANAKAEINPILKWIAGASGSIGANHTQQQTYGVLQDQLASSIASGNDCRRAVLEMFKDKVDYGKSRFDPMPSQNHNLRPRSLPTPQKISEAGLAIDDPIQKVRASGMQGQFGTTPDNKTTFTTPLAIPLNVPNGYSSYAQGLATFVFVNSVIKAIVVTAADPLKDCSQSGIASSIYSGTIRDMGEPAAPPEKSISQETIDMVPYAIESTDYEFSDANEIRVLKIANATAINFAMLRKCVVRVFRMGAADAKSMFNAR